MADETIGKYTGTGLIDAQSIKDSLVDMKGGDLQGCKRQKPGLEAVIEELSQGVAVHGDAAGIHPSVYQSFGAKTALLAQIRALKPAAAKLYVLTITALRREMTMWSDHGRPRGPVTRWRAASRRAISAHRGIRRRAGALTLRS